MYLLLNFKNMKVVMCGHLELISMALWPCSSRNVVFLHGYPVWLLVSSFEEHEILCWKKKVALTETQRHSID